LRQALKELAGLRELDIKEIVFSLRPALTRFERATGDAKRSVHAARRKLSDEAFSCRYC